ncbi:MAG: hypothetical protein JW995_15410 [Melioribacteraceae bacterium]|nr:hypothetical protein [Melioribacteraceae bacterium]
MTKLLRYSFLAVAFILMSCQETSHVVEPENIESVEMQKFIPNDGTSFDFDQFEPNERYSKKLTINGSKGDRVSYSYFWYYGPNKGKMFFATIHVPKGAFKGTKTFNITFDPGNLYVDLDPHGSVFDIPVELSLMFFGINTSEYDLEGKFFRYIDESGDTEIINYQNCVVNEKLGFIMVNRAELHHFSRYGFLR